MPIGDKTGKVLPKATKQYVYLYNNITIDLFLTAIMILSK